MRAAERNRCGGPDNILRLLFGDRASPVLKDAELIADHCRCTVEEIAQLVGFCRRSGGDGTHWYLAGVWITKECFVSPRSAAVCGQCLQEAEFIRGLWDLTFYVACPIHGTHLVTKCTSCQRKIAWNRRSVLKCNCGFDLRLLEAPPADPSALILSSIINGHLDSVAKIDMSDSGQFNTLKRLAELSLDGLFKTIWFLGNVLPTIQAGMPIRGREKPSRDAAIGIVTCAFSYLLSWPTTFIATLEEIALRPTTKSSAPDIDRLYSSVHRYLVSELDQPETAFLRTAYEYQIRQIWRLTANRRPLRNLNRQMEMDFGPDCH